MKLCPYCTKQITDGDSRCAFCGKERSEKVSFDVKDQNGVTLPWSTDCTRERLFAYMIDAVLGIVWIPTFVSIYYYYKYGETLGTRIMGIKIVNDKGVKPGGWRLLGRFFAKFISGIVLGLGYIWILIDKNHQGRHDMMADTYVVKYRPTKKILAVIFVTLFIVLMGLQLFFMLPSLSSTSGG